MMVLDVSVLSADSQGIVLTAGDLTVALSRGERVTSASIGGNELKLLGRPLILHRGELVNTPNLLSNSSFERLRGGVPASWRFEHWGGEGSAISARFERSHGGSRPERDRL